MKKQRIFIIAIFAIIALAYFGIQTVEKRAEESFKKGLTEGFAQTNPTGKINTGDVKYSVINSTLTVKNITTSETSDTASVAIDSLQMVFSNAFGVVSNSEFKAEDIKSIEVNGVKIVAGTFNFGINKFLLVKPQIDLAKALPTIQLIIQANNLDNKVALVEQLELLSESIACEQLLFSGVDFKEGSDNSALSLELLEYNNVKNNIAESFIIKNVVIADEYVDSKLEKIETKNFPVIMGFKYLTNVENLTRPGISSFVLDKFSFMEKGGLKQFSIDQINIQANSENKVIKTTCDVKNMSMSVPQDPNIIEILEKNNLQNIVLNANTSTTIDFIKNTMVVNDSTIDLNKLVNLKASYQIDVKDLLQYQTEYLQALAQILKTVLNNNTNPLSDFMLIQAKLSESQNKSFSLVTGEISLGIEKQLETVAIEIAKVFNPTMTPEIIMAQRKAMADEAAKSLEQIKLTQLKEPVTNFILNLGQITVNAKPSQPVPFLDFSNPSPELFGRLNLSATHKAAN